LRIQLADGLVGELHLRVYPVVLGAGARLFPEGTSYTPLALTDEGAFENDGVLHLTYAPLAA
jgi:dihydrofolate reductase